MVKCSIRLHYWRCNNFRGTAVKIKLKFEQLSALHEFVMMDLHFGAAGQRTVTLLTSGSSQ